MFPALLFACLISLGSGEEIKVDPGEDEVLESIVEAHRKSASNTNQLEVLVTQNETSFTWNGRPLETDWPKRKKVSQNKPYSVRIWSFPMTPFKAVGDAIQTATQKKAGGMRLAMVTQKEPDYFSIGEITMTPEGTGIDKAKELAPLLLKMTNKQLELFDENGRWDVLLEGHLLERARLHHSVSDASGTKSILHLAPSPSQEYRKVFHLLEKLAPHFDSISIVELKKEAPKKIKPTIRRLPVAPNRPLRR
jgi:hypothetical protein